MRTHHAERHRYDRVGWLRAAVLGANDGILSVASILLGVAAATSSRNQIAIAGAAALVAGAMAMATGEFVSVSSQRDTQRADIARERREILQNPDFELAELQEIYQHRGLEPALARTVAERLMEQDALTAHLRDELGLQGHVDTAVGPRVIASRRPILRVGSRSEDTAPGSIVQKIPAASELHSRVGHRVGVPERTALRPGRAK